MRGIFLLFWLIPLSLASLGQEHVLINEIMASNASTLKDAYGEYSDWLELYNPTSSSISLYGWSLTDAEDDLRKWHFPRVSISPGSYLIVFASGKNSVDPTAQLHTNFKLNNAGEFLALVDDAGTTRSLFSTFPSLSADESYNYSGGEYLKSTTATPAAINIITWQQQLAKPVFSSPHGYYNAPFNLQITSEHNNGAIFYTTNGSEPLQNNGTLYTQPITISTTSVLRAAVFVGEIKSSTETATYLFAKDIFKQEAEPVGYPAEWGHYYETEGTAIADYGMDPEIERDRRYRDSLELALLALPALSIVTDIEHLFSHSTHPDSGGIYIYTGNYGTDLGKGWERPASVEYFNGEEDLNFQENIGLKLHGGASRLAEKTPKHSFRLSFKSEFGATKLRYPIFGAPAGTSFNSIVLRAGYGNSWLHRVANERNYALLIRDLWAKDTLLEMGHPAGRGGYVHLFLNGIYWGIYNATERIDPEFGERYLGGSKEEYDIVKDYGELVDGNLDAWRLLTQGMQADLSLDANYFHLRGLNQDGSENPDLESLIDMENYIDYMLLNFYGANWDWDHHNWVAIRNRATPEKGFKFLSWDAEHILEKVDANILDINYENRPSAFFQNLRNNPHFLRLMADRVQKHFFDDGALSPEAGAVRLNKRATEIELAIIAESARWGDYRRDVHPSYPSGPFKLYTKEHWLDQLAYLRNDYFPNRGEVFIRQLRDAELIPQYDAPAFFVNGEPASNTVSIGDEISINPTSGDVYYTVDGTDPLTPNGELSESAIEYTAPIVLNKTLQINVRAFRRDEWSAINGHLFVIANNYHALKITELHYHPLPDGDIDDGNFEFIELKNTGTDSLQLSGIAFTNGISFQFQNHQLPPNHFVVLASDSAHFKSRYQFAPFGQYMGALDNSGERVILTSPTSDTLINLRYNDKAPWPESPDGDGYSLVARLYNPTDTYQLPSEWRASAEIHGSPGKDDPVSTAAELEAMDILTSYSLHQNYPNPFNPNTVISYQLPTNSKVSLRVFDVLGREVATLVDGIQTAGKHSANFDASTLSSGVYIYQIHTSEFVSTKKMLLIK